MNKIGPNVSTTYFLEQQKWFLKIELLLPTSKLVWHVFFCFSSMPILLINCLKFMPKECKSYIFICQNPEGSFMRQRLNHLLAQVFFPEPDRWMAVAFSLQAKILNRKSVIFLRGLKGSFGIYILHVIDLIIQYLVWPCILGVTSLKV